MAATIVSLPCPGCRGTLYVTPDQERLRCDHCGVELIVERAGGGVSLKLVEERQDGMRESVEERARSRDRAADELLLQRVGQQRQATASVLEEEERLLDKMNLDHWLNWHWEREFAFAVVALFFSVWGALDSLTRGITSRASPLEVGIGVVIRLFLGVLFLDFARWSWSVGSDRRCQIGLLKARRQELRDKVGQLKEQEASIRRRLEA